MKNLGSGDTNTIWTVTEGERERLLHPAKLRRGRRMSKQREERMKAKTGAQQSKGDWGTNGKGDLSSMALSVAEGKTKMLSTSFSVLEHK